MFDHPKENTTGMCYLGLLRWVLSGLPIGFVRVGKMEMVSYILDAEGQPKKVFTYPLTRIRSWKVGGKVGMATVNSL